MSSVASCFAIVGAHVVLLRVEATRCACRPKWTAFATSRTLPRGGTNVRTLSLPFSLQHLGLNCLSLRCCVLRSVLWGENAAMWSVLWPGVRHNDHNGLLSDDPTGYVRLTRQT